MRVHLSGPHHFSKRQKREADPELLALIELCLNALEGFSAVLFVADKPDGPMRLRAVKSLSPHIDAAATIYPGQGLLGWAYKNGQSVNVDQVSFESERLLFYTCDENIKSFMAVPLPEISGVLALDSKQRYVFTDKSAKILMQFAKSISQVWRRLFGRPTKPLKAEGFDTDTSTHSGQNPENEICALWQGLEFCLSHSDHAGGGLSAALELIRQFTGLTWAFLTVLKPGDNKNYYLIALSDNAPEMPRKTPLSSGLAGWLHTKEKPLYIDKLKADSRNSYVFQKNEPDLGFRSFYGWPILYNDQVRGSLVLAGREGETLDPVLIEVLDCVVDRLAAQFHLDRLIMKLMEMEETDAQTNLPSRGFFLDNLAHLMEVADLKGDKVDLFVLATSGLGSFAAEYGQAAAGALLKSLAKELKGGLLPSWRLGHVSYGVFTLAVPSADRAESKKFLSAFKKKLQNWPLSDHSGRVELGLFLALGTYPNDGDSPEKLLEVALLALAQGG